MLRLAAILALLTSPAMAANCAQRDVVIERLSTKYQETQTAGGLQSSKSIMEVWASEESGTFTVILTHPNGLSCIVASGTHWYVDTTEKKDPPA